jgi:3-deoxy-7-phosphoheptulonate synthase
MVVVLQRDIRDAQKHQVRTFLENHGFTVREIAGVEETIFGAVGSAPIDLREVEVLPGVDKVVPISKPYKLASRELKKDDTVVQVGPVRFGGSRLTVIAGPCAVESREQILEVARVVRKSGAVMLRGGAFKPRTSPYSFQGLGEEGLRYLKEAGDATGMPVISEVVSPSHVAMMREYVDMFQIGARNMQNFELLKEVGATGMPVMVKRGLSATIEEWLMAAEYVLAHGTENVVLCDRGIRTFETYTRNSLDISSIPVVKKLSHLPVLVDPSHATGLREKVPPVALAAAAVGADGIIVEVHTDPEIAMSDGPQTLYPEQFEKLMRDLEAMTPVLGRELVRLPDKPDARPVFGGGAPSDTAGDHGVLKVAFQGARGAYSETALLRFFQANDVRAEAKDAFRDVFEAVLQGQVEYGVIPLENSLAGSVHENYDLLLRYPDVSILAETQIRVEHCLIGPEHATVETVRTVYSHPQGLAQCRQFLEDHGMTALPHYDTAGSVELVAEKNDPTVAAIASRESAAIYGMNVLREGIETNPHNYTRFAIVGHRDHPPVDTPNMAALVLATPDSPGALAVCLKVLAERDLNLKKLESRPIPGKPWNYMFYLVVQIPEDQAKFEAGMTALAEVSEELRTLGLYRL